MGDFPIFDIIILFGGLYLLYGAFQMSKDKKIPGVLLSKDMKLTRESDTEAFVQAMLKPTVIMGIVAVVSGVLGIACTYYPNLAMVQLAVLGISFVCLIAYGYIDVRAQKKYLHIK